MKKILVKISSAIIFACCLATVSLSASSETFGFGVQTSGYFFRSNIAQSKFIVWDTEQYETKKVALSDFRPDAYYAESVRFDDARVTCDGTYTVSFSGIPKSNLSGTLKANAYNWLLLTSDLDVVKNPNVTITIDKLSIGGKTVLSNVKLTKDGSQKYMIADLLKEASWSNSFTSTIKNTLRVQFANCYDEENSLISSDNIPYADNATCTFTIKGFRSNSDNNNNSNSQSEPVNSEPDESSKEETSDSNLSSDDSSQYTSSVDVPSNTENSSSESSDSEDYSSTPDESSSSDDSSYTDVDSGSEASDSYTSDDNSNSGFDTDDSSIPDDKNNVDTGVEGIALATGISVLAAATALISKKKSN